MKVLKKRTSLPLLYLSSFCMELSLIIKAGISINDGLAILYEDEHDFEIKNVLSDILKNANNNLPFHEALRQTGRFPDYMINMIEIGAYTGKSEHILHRLASYYVNRENINTHVKNAVIYPSVLFLLMIVVIILLIGKVLPLFNNVFSQFGSEFSPFAKALLNIGHSIQSNIVLVIIIFILFVSSAVFIYANEKTKNAFLKIFTGRRAAATLLIAKFTDAMSICISSGLDIEKSLEMSDKLVHSTSLSKKIIKCKSLLSQGLSASDAFSKSQLYSGLYSRMIYVGFITGNADIVMHEIAGRLENAAHEQINAAVSKVEPTMVIVLSVLVGIILLSVMIPLMSVMSVIG